MIQRKPGAAAAAALGIDAYAHLHDAGFYDAATSSVISQATLFRVQAALAAAGLTVAISARAPGPLTRVRGGSTRGVAS